MKNNNCKICGILQTGWETVNTPESSTRDAFPSNLDLLQVIKEHKGITPYTLYQCPQCSAYFLRHKTQEWDAYAEAMLDIEKLHPIEAAEALRLTNNKTQPPVYAVINTSRHCSRCGCGNVEKLRETKVKKDILVWYKCLGCGNEEFMDVYEDFEPDEN